MTSRNTLALGLALTALTTGLVSAETVWLDSLNVSGATQDWGDPHKNQSVNGNPLGIGGKSFEHGFGTHAESTLYIKLGGGTRTFSASVGVDDDVNKNPAASIEFLVGGDGKTLWQSGVMKAGDAAKVCTVDVTGVTNLLLQVTDAGDGISYDHADWADAKFDVFSGSPVAVGGEEPLPVVAPYILTPNAPATPRINGANVFGVRPGSPFLFTIPATGERPMKFSAGKLPRGLKLDPQTGHITGTLKTKGEFIVTLRAKFSADPAFAKVPEGEKGRTVKHTFWLTPSIAAEPNVWYAGTSPQGIFRSNDGGVTWGCWLR